MSNQPPRDKDGNTALGPNAVLHTEAFEKVREGAGKIIEERVETNRRRLTKLERLKCWPEVLAMIENSATVSDIATFIQTERAEYLEVSKKSLEAVIYYFLSKNRDRIMDRAPVRHHQLIKSTDRVDPLDALNMLFSIQVDRITEHYQAEKRTGTYTSFNNNALRLAKEMTKLMAEIDHRRNPRPSATSAAKGPADVFAQTERIRLAYEQRFGATAAGVLMNDESRRKILEALERLRRRGSSKELMEILDHNTEKAKQLAEKEIERARLDAEEDAQTIDVEHT